MNVFLNVDGYTITVTNEDLRKAFSSPTNYQFFLHGIFAKMVGEDIAERLFPIKGIERSNE